MHSINQIFSQEATNLCVAIVCGTVGVISGAVYGTVKTVVQYQSIIDETDTGLEAVFAVVGVLSTNILDAVKVLGVSGLMLGAALFAPDIMHDDSLQPKPQHFAHTAAWPTLTAFAKFRPAEVTP